MNTSNTETGVLPSTSLAPQPEPYSPDKKYFEEQWLMEMGLMPTISIDTMLGYAYSQPAVVGADLCIDQDEDNDGAAPVVTYKIRVKRRWRLAVAQWGETHCGVFGKLVTLMMIRLGAPLNLRWNLVFWAKRYLPAKYNVHVEFK